MNVKHYFFVFYAFLFFSCSFSWPIFGSQKMAHTQDKKLIIGVDADLSLAAKSSGEAILAGVKIAAEEINENGGLLGYQVQVEARDHAGVSARGIANIREFVGLRNLIGVVGGIHSNVILSELDEIHAHKIPYLIPWAAAVDVVDNGKNPNFVFRLGARDELVGRFLVSEALKRGSKIALLLENTVWGRSNRQAMMNALKQKGHRPVSIQWVDRGVSNLSPQIFEILASKADVVLMVLNGPESALAVRQIADRQASFVVLSHWGLTSGGFYDLASAALAKVPVYFFQPFSFLTNDKPLTRALFHSYQKMFGKTEPDLIRAAAGVAHAYDLTRMLAQALKAAGTLDRGKIRDSLEALPFYNGVSITNHPPFTQKRHEALSFESYFLAKFNKKGGIEPL